MSHEKMQTPADEIVTVTEQELKEQGGHMDALERRKAEVTWEVLQKRYRNVLKEARELGISPSQFLDGNFHIEAYSEPVEGEKGWEDKHYEVEFEFTADNLKGHSIRIKSRQKDIYEGDKNTWDINNPIECEAAIRAADGTETPLSPDITKSLLKKYQKFFEALSLDRYTFFRDRYPNVSSMQAIRSDKAFDDRESVIKEIETQRDPNSIIEQDLLS